MDRGSTILIAAAANAALAAFVRWRYGANRLHRVFAGMVAGVASYSLFLAGLARAEDAAAAAAWVRLTAGLGYGAIFGFYWFSMVLSGQDRRPWARRVLGASLVVASVDVLSRFAGLAPARFERLGDQGWFPAQDLLYQWAYLPTMAVLVLSALGALWLRHQRSQSALERRQIAYVFLAIAGATLVSGLNVVPAAAFLASLSPVFFSAVLTYGITRSQLLDLRLLLRQGALGAVLSLMLALFLALAMLALRGALIADNSAAGVLGLVAAASLFVLVYEPLRRLSARLLDRVFDLGELDIGARLLDYAQLSGRYPRLEDLLAAVCGRLRDEHGLERVLILLPDRGGGLSSFSASPPEATPPALRPGAALLASLQQSAQGRDLDELSWVRRYERDHAAPGSNDGEDALRDYLRSAACQLAFALRSGDGRVLGLLLIGPPRDGRGLRPVERAFFAALAPQLAVVLDNALLQGQVRHADRLQSLGALAAGLAHELRNPLSSIMVFVQMLPERFHDAPFRERFGRVVQQELDKLNRLTEQLLQISRPQTQPLAPLELAPQVARVEQLLRYQFRQRQVALRVDCPEALWVRGSADEFTQVLINLLINALAVSESEQAVELNVSVHAGRVRIQVEDHGPGIEPQHLERLFEPFFTTKADGNGLGLATSLRIIESFGGSLSAANRAEGGACFTIELPAAQPMQGADLDQRHRSGEGA